MNGRHTSVRMLAMLLCIVLVATMIPVFASAASVKAPKMKKVENVLTGVKVTWKSVSGAASYRVFRKTSAKKSAWKAVGETANTHFIDTTVRSGDTYYYAVRAVNSAGQVKSDYSKNPLKIVYYKAPKMLSATVQTNGILVKWKASKGAPLYQVYRSTEGGKWKKIGTSKTAQYLDKRVRYGKEYRYYVRVISKDKKKKLSDHDHTPIEAIFTKKAAISSLANKNGYILVKWSKVKGADQYKLYRKIGAGDWFAVTTTTDKSYKDTKVLNNVTYTYQVRALDSAGEVIGLYDAGKSITYYATPVMKSVVRSEGNLVVSWDAVEGISNYIIYRKIDGGEWIKVGTSTTTTFTDSTMPSGTFCTYTVACADAAGTAVSTYGVYTKGAESYKDRPILTAISNGDGSVTVTWQSVDTAIKYKVLRQIGDDISADGWKTIATTANTSYTDTSVKNAEKYTYTVCACDGSGNNQSMYDTTGISITYYKPPTLVSVTNELTGAKIKWSKVDGVPNYKIWRKTGNAAWTVIATVHGATAGYVYTDTNVVNNGHYCYSVSGVANSESAFLKPGLDTRFYNAPVITSVVTHDGDITVSWSAVESISAYRVERKIGGTNYWTTVSSSQSDRSYKDTNVTSGKKYIYRISSLKSGSVVSGRRRSTDRYYLDRPIIKSLTPGKGTVTIKWDVAVVGASSYDVYAAVYPGGTLTKVASAVPVAKSCTIKNLTSGQRYAFKLVAVKGDSRSAESVQRYATPK